MYSLWLSWKHIISKPATLALNLILLALSTGLIAAVLLFNQMLTNRLDKNLAGIDMVLGAKGSPLQIILSAMYHIDVPTGNIPLEAAQPFMRKDHPLIRQAIPLSLGDSYKGYRIVGTNEQFFDMYHLKIQAGASFQKPMDIVAGAQVAKILGLKVGDTFQSVHGLDDNDDLIHEDSHPFRVVGILTPSGSVADQLLLCNLESVWAVHGHVHDHDHATCGHDHSQDAPPEITNLLIQFKVRNHLTLNLPRNINENTSLQAAAPAMELNRLYSLLGSGTVMLQWLAWIIMAVAGISIFVSLFSSLEGRKYALALMRVLGSTPGGLFRMIILEGILMAMAGALIGLLLAHGGVWLAGRFLESEWRYSFEQMVLWKAEGFLFLGVVILGAFAAIIPAWRAMRVDIGETLSNG